MKRLLWATLFSATIAASTGATAQNLLTNGELTDPQGNNEAANGWSKSEPTLDGNSNPIDSFRFQKAGFADASDDNLSSTPVPGPDGNTATADLGGMWFRAFLGNNASNPNIFVDASAWQDVPATAGQQYNLTFSEKHEFYFTATEARVELQFYSGGGSGTLLGSTAFDLLATPGTNTDNLFIEPWFVRSLTATAPAGTDTARVLAMMNDGRDNPTVVTFKPQSLMLDRFSLTAVPEPTSCFLGAAGALCLWLRRRGR